MTVKIDPLDTPDQRAFEAGALRLLEHATARATQADVAAYWQERIKPTPAQQRWFESEFTQVAFSVAMESLNQDPQYPRIHAFGRFAHTVDGARIPATKVGNPNPDYIYRFIAIDDDSRYLIRGRTLGPAPVAAEFSILTPEQKYLANLSARHIRFEKDGSFAMSIDSAPAGDRPNQMQTGGGACQVLIRDLLADVAMERPYALTVERLGPPTRPAFDEAHALSIFGTRLRKFVDDLLFIGERMIFNKPANIFPEPVVNKGGIYSVAQAYAAGHFKLERGEALVISLTLGGAAYAVVPVNNIWGGIGDYLNHRSTLGTGRALPNPDGSYTFVVSLADPGVANWVDTDGMNEGVMFLRWAGLDPDYTGAPPRLQTIIVPFTEVSHALPPGVPRVTPVERRAQLARHATDYNAWLGEG